MPDDEKPLLDESEALKNTDTVQAMLAELQKTNADLTEQRLDEFVFQGNLVKVLIKQIDEQQIDLKKRQELARKFLDAYAKRQRHWKEQHNKSRDVYLQNRTTANILAVVGSFSAFASLLAAVPLLAPISLHGIITALIGTLVFIALPIIVYAAVNAVSLATLHYFREPHLHLFGVGRALFDRKNPNNYIVTDDIGIWEIGDLTEAEIANTKVLLKNNIQQQTEQVQAMRAFIANGRVEESILKNISQILFKPKENKPVESLLTRSENIRKFSLTDGIRFGSLKQFKKEKIAINAAKAIKKGQGLTPGELNFFARRYQQAGGKPSAAKAGYEQLSLV